MSEIQENDSSLGFQLKDLLAQKKIPFGSIEQDRIKISELEKENQSLKAALAEYQNRKSHPEKTIADQVRAFRETAIQKLKKEEYLEAVGFLHAALVLEADHSKTMINLSVAYAQLGMQEKAAVILEAVLKKDPDNETAKRNLEILTGE